MQSTTLISVIICYISLAIAIILFITFHYFKLESYWILRGVGFFIGISIISSCYGIYLKYFKTLKNLK